MLPSRGCSTAFLIWQVSDLTEVLATALLPELPPSEEGFDGGEPREPLPPHSTPACPSNSDDNSDGNSDGSHGGGVGGPPPETCPPPLLTRPSASSRTAVGGGATSRARRAAPPVLL